MQTRTKIGSNGASSTLDRGPALDPDSKRAAIRSPTDAWSRRDAVPQKCQTVAIAELQSPAPSSTAGRGLAGILD